MKRITLITGSFGSGKSEFSINYALALNTQYHVVLADLDIINPYFRSVEAKEVLEAQGIEFISSSFEGQSDLPAITGELFRVLNNEDENKHLIIDLAGDVEGSRVLGYISDYLNQEDIEFYFCFNANRHMGDILKMIEYIEAQSQLKITGIINTTHLIEETTAQEIEKGYHLALELGYPVIYNVHLKDLDIQCPNPFPITRYLKKPWEV